MNIQEVVKILSSEAGLKYLIYNNHSDFCLPVSVRLEASFLNQKFFSWGVAENEDLAFFKALMELLERVVLTHSCPLEFKKKKIIFPATLNISSLSFKSGVPKHLLYSDNSNGCGIHLRKPLAMESARLELLERHVLLSALLLDVRPLKTIYEHHQYSIPPRYTLNYYYWSVDKEFIVLCLGISPDSGLFFSHSCSTTLKSALKKAFEEISPLVIADSIKTSRPTNYDIIKNDVGSFGRYWRYSGDQRILKWLSCEEPKEQTEASWSKIPRIKEIYYGRFNLPNEISFLSKIIFPYKAISPDAQQLFFDNWNDKYVNRRVFSCYRLPEFPHFIA